MRNLQTVGGRIKQIRSWERLTQQDFAPRVGMKSTGYLSQVENGAKEPGYKIFLSIANNFPKYSLYWLLTGEGKPLDNDKDNTYNPAHSPLQVLAEHHQLTELQQQKLACEIAEMQALNALMKDLKRRE